ncbi:MAG: PIN domain-containing protein [Pirellulales bacterium]|nr:PIN domain-containing protein [Pirellulales bacterium]
MNPVFLDSVGLVALWASADQWHPAAQRVFADLQAARRVYVTTPYVLAECGNAASRRPFRRDVVELRNRLEANNGLIHPTDQEWIDAWAEYERGRPGDPGIVDCISFAVMCRLGITEAFTNDQHFTAAGFTTLF